DWFPHQSWSQIVLDDLAQTADIAVELIPTREEAERLVSRGRRPAVLILGRNFSKRVARASFLATDDQPVTMLIPTLLSPAGPLAALPPMVTFQSFFREDQDFLPLYLLQGINPYHRNGVNLAELDVEILVDPTQKSGAAIIHQVAQGSLLRVVLPWMIGRA